MSKLGLVLLAATMAVPSVAGAQAEREGAKGSIAAGASFTFWLPQGDADDLAEESPGFRIAAEYWFTDYVALAVSFDWVFVNEKDGGFIVVEDAQYYSIGIGGRVTTPRPARIKPFGELMLHRATLTVDATDYDESDVGFRFGGGGIFEIAPGFEAIAEVTYSAVEIEDADIDGISLEAGVRGRF
jgi:hypothetical protein